MRRQLPSLISLTCFAAFARHMSVTRAAEELSLTQGAVSRQIKNLEDMLGRPLVEKVRQRLLLTEDGQRYVEEIAPLLDQLEAATRRVSARQSGRLRVGAEPSLTTRWLLPKLKAYGQLHPEIELQVMNDLQRLYEQLEGFDLAILFGDGHWRGFEAQRLMDGEMVAVCTPDLLQRHGPVAERRDILRYPLLHHSALAAQGKSSTQLWLLSAGLSPREIDALPGQRLEHFQFVLDAALHGLGITVLPRYFVAPEVEDGRLVIASREPLVCGDYYLVWPEGCRDARVRMFAEWLLAAQH
ncbi:LysR family transcriptional regulator [Pseudomonas sp. BN417]|uniref:LysR substrate-binding domain-containing protein n=1 Tax=Pseudomonas sp. BN417 TaxID=2567890 RepID=UPI0024575D39|nr:LysR substrate-binding domain-containing protein [Pseudomonas sp. BN417]MDH4558004.1 LysR family transcriptional regulator [Pseudomonas sp. BN417]